MHLHWGDWLYGWLLGLFITDRNEQAEEIATEGCIALQLKNAPCTSTYCIVQNFHGTKFHEKISLRQS